MEPEMFTVYCCMYIIHVVMGQSLKHGSLHVLPVKAAMMQPGWNPWTPLVGKPQLGGATAKN
jgi:hypothetical protein